MMMTAEHYMGWIEDQIKSNEKEIVRLKSTIDKIEKWNDRLRESHKEMLAQVQAYKGKR